VTVWAQDNSTGTGNRPRVFITDSKSWEMSGGGGGTSDGFGGASRGGARPQTAEIIKTFGERCPDVIVNNKQEKADYVVLLDHEGGKGVIFRDNKVAVFNADGDSIVSRSTRSLGNAVKDACDAISKDWPPRQARKANERAGLTGGNSAPAVVTVSADPKSAELEIESNPAGAEIEIDGNFVGSTPSSVSADPGQHQILVKKAGYQPWQRNVKISGGHVRLDAELEVGK
jgi:PEGA domain